MKDLRTLCDKAIQLWDADCDMDGVINEMRSHLAQPEPEGPTDEELLDLANDHGVSTDKPFSALVSTILTRWGRPAIEPVPVEERLPGPEDCDAEGRCWLRGNVEGDWRLVDPSNTGVPQLKYCFSHWLPRHALPVPLP